MKKVLFVGQAPSKDTDGLGPFAGRSGRRLASLCGLRHDEFLSTFDLANLLDRWPGKCGKGDAFPLDKARAGIARLDLAGRPLVVLVGKQVARAFGAKVAYFEPLTVGSVPAVIVPHPSGVNRWWNDPANEEQARKFMRSLPRTST